MLSNILVRQFNEIPNIVLTTEKNQANFILALDDKIYLLNKRKEPLINNALKILVD